MSGLVMMWVSHARAVVDLTRELLEGVRMLPLLILLSAFIVEMPARGIEPHRSRTALLAEAIRKVPRGEALVDVPPQVIDLLPEFKRALRDDVRKALLANSTLEGARREVFNRWLAEGIVAIPEAGDEDEGGMYVNPADWDFAHVQGFTVTPEKRHPNLLSITIDLAIPYGGDVSLYIFDTSNAAFVLNVEQLSYSSINLGANLLEYQVSPKAADGSWFVVAARTGAWPSSNWRTLRVGVYEPSNDDCPRQILAYEGFAWLGDDEPFTVSATRDSFTVLYEGDARDTDKIIRSHVVKFRREKGRFRRVPPVAAYPDDFVDEWIAAPWEDARRWSNPARRNELHAMHVRLHQDDRYFGSIYWEQLCELTGKRTVVQIADDDVETYAIVSLSPQFRVEEFRSSIEELCRRPYGER
jgi:hypothetical protein